MKLWQIVIRLVLVGFCIWKVYGETGPWTAIVFVLLTIACEVAGLAIHRMHELLEFIDFTRGLFGKTTERPRDV